MRRVCLMLMASALWVFAEEVKVIQIPSAASLADWISGLDGTLRAGESLLPTLRIMDFGKPIQTWDDYDFQLVSRTAQRFAQESRAGRGPEFEDRLLPRIPLIVAKIKLELQQEAEATVLDGKIQERRVQYNRWLTLAHRAQMTKEEWVKFEELKLVLEADLAKSQGEQRKELERFITDMNDLRKKSDQLAAAVHERLRIQREAEEVEKSKAEEARRNSVVRWTIIFAFLSVGGAIWWNHHQSVHETNFK